MGSHSLDYRDASDDGNRGTGHEHSDDVCLADDDSEFYAIRGNTGCCRYACYYTYADQGSIAQKLKG